MASPQKRPKIESNSQARSSLHVGNLSSTDEVEEKTIVYFIPERIQKKRLQIMRNCAKSVGFDVRERFDTDTTHIITDFDQEQQVITSLKVDINDWERRIRKAKIVNTKWFTDSAKLRKPLPVSREHCLEPLPVPKKSKSDNKDQTAIVEKVYICQRAAKLDYKNKRFTDALELLGAEAELRDTSDSYSRSLAFRRASAVLKSLSFEITRLNEVSNLKDIGDHSLTVIGEILEHGRSEEVNNLKNSEWFLTVQLFTKIYGIGPSTANKWYEGGFRTIDDIKSLLSEVGTRIDNRVEYGVAFFQDLSAAVTHQEAQRILSIIKQQAHDILPGVILEVTGGFRRGNTTGHDIDILMTHPVAGKEKGFLEHLYKQLQNRGYILHATFEHAKSEEHMLFHTKDNTMDNYEKCFCIFKLPKSDGARVDSHPNKDGFKSLCDLADSDRNWRAKRVDIIISPISQYAYALLGWTGNKQFNRSLRYYAKKELNMKLTSHGLFHAMSGQWLKADTEEEIFRHLKLDYLHPHERNP